MTTPTDPRSAPSEASARVGAPRVVSIALVAVLVGTGLLAVQNCGADNPAPQQPTPTAQPAATAAPTQSPPLLPPAT